jgi:hypothetical protein
MQGLQAINTMEFAVRGLRGWAVPYVVPVAAAARVFDQDGRIQDRAVELQLRTLGEEVVRVAERFASNDSVHREAECANAAERVGPPRRVGPSVIGSERGSLRSRPGLLGRWCVVIERVRDDFRRTEQESAVLVQRLFARLVRVFFEFLVLVLIAVAELDTLWRRAGNALAVRPRR